MGKSHSRSAVGLADGHVHENRGSFRNSVEDVKGIYTTLTKKLCRPNGALPKNRRSCTPRYLTSQTR